MNNYEDFEINGRILVNGQYKFGKFSGKENIEHHDEKQLRVYRFAEGVTPAIVKFGAKSTINMGDGTYEFCTIDVGVELPCHVEELDEAFCLAKQIVQDQAKPELDKMKELRDARNAKLTKKKG